MQKIPTSVKVHAYGEGFNDSFWISVTENLNMYELAIIWPGAGLRQPIACVCDYEIKEEIMRFLGRYYEEEPVAQINITWNYNHEEDD